VRFTRILVPLDGSRLAEAVLPAASWLARRAGARLLLLHVLEREPPERVHGEPHHATQETAAADLEAHAERLRARGIAVEVHVHERPVGDVATAIEGHVHELRGDLIAMCAHGRTNLRTRLTGSIAERILRGGSVPILLRTAHQPDDRDFQLRRMLVPIDFGHDVDAALASVRAIAPASGTAVVLLSALERKSPPATLLLPGTSAILREFDRGAIERRLEELAAGLRGDVASVETVVSDRRPADAIATEVASLAPDLILLVTDAHTRLARWSDPSATQRLLAVPDLVLLLMREM
jgi:nucleotide-binding universal stress UspA family protein